MDHGTRGRAVRGCAAIVAIAVVVTGVFAGVASAQTDAGGGEKVFIYGDTSEPSSLNPMKGYLGTDYTIWAVEYNLPIEFAPKDFGPDLERSIVTSVDTGTDNMTFTYHMREGMKWSDGEPFTASDVAWTLNYYHENKISNYIADLKLVDNVEVVDETTFTLHATQPTSVYSGATVFMYD